MVVVTPKMSEKAYKSAQTGTYVFNVPVHATKQQIISAVETDHSVKVLDARMVVSKGKAVRSSRGKRAQPGISMRSTTKKAYVRLAEGQKLNLFNEEEEKK